MLANDPEQLRQNVERLRKIHADFLTRMALFEKEEKDLAQKVRKAIDEKKIHNVLDKIIKMKTQ